MKHEANNSNRRFMQRILCAACAAIFVAALSGCHSTSTPSSSFSLANIFQSQPDTVEYPGPPRFWNKAGLVISPARIIAQVGTEVPIFAGVCDDKGQLQPYERVEWMLDSSGVGSLVSVNEAHRPISLDLVSANPKKIDNHYAIGETLPDNVIVTRGTPGMNDDTVMPRGYTFATVSSPREGVSYITAFAPDVYSWDVRQRNSRIQWIDAEWTFPEPGCVPAGAHAALVTCVQRHSTKAPVQDWIVKYCITGGAEATFGPSGSKSVEIGTDAEGKATVELIPGADVTSGSTCVSMELIRSECAGGGEGERLSIATAATQVNWGKSEPAPAPASAAPIPAPAPGPAPPAGTQVSPPGGGMPAPSLRSPPSQTPPPAASSGQTPPAAPPAAPPRIEVRMTGPETAKLEEKITFHMEIANLGNAPVDRLAILDRFDPGLQHTAAGKTTPDNSPISFNGLMSLAAGETKPADLTFRVIKPGRLCQTVEVNGPGGIHVTKELCVNVEAPPEHPVLEVHIATPQRNLQVGNQATFTITAVNRGPTIPAQDVKVVVGSDQGLQIVRYTQGGQITRDGKLQFSLGTIPPLKQMVLQVVCDCISPTAQACARMTASESTEMFIGESACVQIAPAPPGTAAALGPLRVQVRSLNNPARIGSDVTYDVRIINAGTADDKQVTLTLTIPDQMSFISAPQGPSAFDSVDNGRTVRFKPVMVMRPNETLIPYEIHLRANSAGTAQVVAEVISQNQPQGVRDSGTTTINNQ
ncbi:MAG TPA: hypothetical protein VGJ15_09130 [Pirellulales bacterium]